MPITSTTTALDLVALLHQAAEKMERAGYQRGAAVARMNASEENHTDALAALDAHHQACRLYHDTHAELVSLLLSQQRRVDSLVWATTASLDLMTLDVTAPHPMRRSTDKPAGL